MVKLRLDGSNFSLEFCSFRPVRLNLGSNRIVIDVSLRWLIGLLLFVERLLLLGGLLIWLRLGAIQFAIVISFCELAHQRREVRCAHIASLLLRFWFENLFKCLQLGKEVFVWSEVFPVELAIRQCFFQAKLCFCNHVG